MAILVSVLLLVVLTTLAAFVYWITTRGDAKKIEIDTESNLSTAVKKHPIGDTASYKRIAFFSGLFITLLFVTVLIEYKEYEIEEIIQNTIIEEFFFCNCGVRKRKNTLLTVVNCKKTLANSKMVRIA